jgi:hypothetical protein
MNLKVIKIKKYKNIQKIYFTNKKIKKIKLKLFEKKI